MTSIHAALQRCKALKPMDGPFYDDAVALLRSSLTDAEALLQMVDEEPRTPKKRPVTDAIWKRRTKMRMHPKSVQRQLQSQAHQGLAPLLGQRQGPASAFLLRLATHQRNPPVHPKPNGEPSGKPALQPHLWVGRRIQQRRPAGTIDLSRLCGRLHEVRGQPKNRGRAQTDEYWMPKTLQGRARRTG